MKITGKHILIYALALSIIACARRGRPTGGDKDVTAPLLVSANPPNETTNFKSKRIRIYFDEYITLKDLSKQLIVSPPLKHNSIITPLGTPSKYINIKIVDTLQPNTTYTFNFGNSIQDNNEGNKLESFKYVFSTGAYIDSLKVRGSLENAYSKDSVKNGLALLYKITSEFNDSIVYKQKPNYVVNTLDASDFEFTNIQEGEYLLVALKDISNNYLFNTKEDKIGVYKRRINLPKDSILEDPIILYTEKLPLKLVRPEEVSKGKLVFGFEGNPKGLKIELLNSEENKFTSIAKFEEGKDSLNFWFKGNKSDSIFFKATAANNFIDTLKVKLRKKETDSLILKSTTKATLQLKDTFALISNNPIQNIDTTRIDFFDKDTLKVAYSTVIDQKTNKVFFNFKKANNNNYTLKLYPKAITDFFNQENDSLSYKFNTTSPEAYGNISLTVDKEIDAPVIIELLTEKEEVVRKVYVLSSRKVNFDLLPPNKYLIRTTIDTNRNGKWDTGNYLQKKIPETVTYFSKVLPVRANWDVNETLTIK